MRQQFVSSLLAVFVFFVVSLGLLKFSGPLPIAVQSTTTAKTDSFSVSGEGKSSMKPDTAYVSVGVSAQGASVKEVQDQINAIINKISQAIKQLGVDSTDIQTTNYNVSPNYDYSSGSQKIHGYQASTNVSIKVRDINKVNAVIDQATVSGATQVYGINFAVADKEKAQNEAREKAVADAKKKAEQAAKIAGFRLGKLVNYSENLGGAPVPVPRTMALDKAVSSAPTQVEPGSQEISVSVTLQYEVQ